MDCFASIILEFSGDHFAVVSSGGSLLCWGRNDYQQTSVVGKTGKILKNFLVKLISLEVPEPVTVCGLNHVIQVACGSNHTVALTRNGRVYAFGANNFGQLGNGQRSAPFHMPQQVKELENVRSIAAGSGHTLALCPNRLHSFGLNNNGQVRILEL